MCVSVCVSVCVCVCECVCVCVCVCECVSVCERFSVSNDELVAAPVLITPVWQIPADDDRDLPAPDQHTSTLKHMPHTKTLILRMCQCFCPYTVKIILLYNLNLNQEVKQNIYISPHRKVLFLLQNIQFFKCL